MRLVSQSWTRVSGRMHSQVFPHEVGTPWEETPGVMYPGVVYPDVHIWSLRE